MPEDCREQFALNIDHPVHLESQAAPPSLLLNRLTSQSTAQTTIARRGPPPPHAAAEGQARRGSHMGMSRSLPSSPNSLK